eukprot:6502541-Prymnesium_polylepis.1
MPSMRDLRQASAQHLHMPHIPHIPHLPHIHLPHRRTSEMGEESSSPPSHRSQGDRRQLSNCAAAISRRGRSTTPAVPRTRFALSRCSTIRCAVTPAPRGFALPPLRSPFHRRVCPPTAAFALPPPRSPSHR